MKERILRTLVKLGRLKSPELYARDSLIPASDSTGTQSGTTKFSPKDPPPGIPDDPPGESRLPGRVPGDECVGPAAGVSPDQCGSTQPRAADSLWSNAAGVPLCRLDWQDPPGKDHDGGRLHFHRPARGFGPAAACQHACGL